MKVDYDLYYKDSGSVNKGHYVESNESVSISLSHDYTTTTIKDLNLTLTPGYVILCIRNNIRQSTRK